MGNKKELRKMTQTEKAIIQARGEAIMLLGIVVIAICMILAVIEIGFGAPIKALAFLIVVLAYVTGALILSYKYQKTKMYMILSIIGGALTLLSLVLYLLQ